jgi:hypothetical protein
MPPTIAAAIGFITSEPLPDPYRMGARLTRAEQYGYGYSSRYVGVILSFAVVVAAMLGIKK